MEFNRQSNRINARLAAPPGIRHQVTHPLENSSAPPGHIWKSDIWRGVKSFPVREGPFTAPHERNKKNQYGRPESRNRLFFHRLIHTVGLPRQSFTLLGGKLSTNCPIYVIGTKLEREGCNLWCAFSAGPS